MYEISTSSNFSSAHHLLNYNGQCENLHGHNWDVKATVRCSLLDKAGLGIDFKILKKALREITGSLDHTDLNERLKGKVDNPSSELIAKYIFEELKGKLAAHANCQVFRIEIYETPNNCAAYFE
jgi:6-pyruvoyltetrahydropterin/6-carboxytetrahydropterin synthase